MQDSLPFLVGVVGEKVTLPLREGKAITLLRKASVAQKDGSVTWSGTVEETGERAVLMLWGNAVLTGYLAYNGTIFTIESLGGGVHAFAEMDRRKLPADHPPEGPARDSARTTDAEEAPKPRAAPPEPVVAPFADAERQAREAKKITSAFMII